MPADRLLLATSETVLSPGVMMLSGAVLVLLLAFYSVLAVRVSAKSVLTSKPFGMPDIICAGILTTWMISVLWQSYGAHSTITLKAILGNSIVYLFLISGIFGVIGFQSQSAVSYFGLGFSRFPKAAAKGLLWLVCTYPLILATQWFVQGFAPDRDDAQDIVRYFLEHPDPRHRLAVIVMAVIVAPVAEEVLFRGYLYGVMRRLGGRIPAILTSSLLFAAIHANLPSMPGLTILAVILCLLYERTGSLWATMTMHAAFNAITIATLIFFPELAG
jgi:membrane protease YdiL (CAAX protease family)